MKQYTVQKGDSLWKISKSNGVSLEALVAANPQIQNPNSISVGDIINIPSTADAVSDLAPGTETGEVASVVTPQLVTDATVLPPQVTVTGTTAGSTGLGSTGSGASTPKWGQLWKYVVKNQDTMWKIAKQAGVSLEQLIAANPQVADPNKLQPGQVLNIPSGSLLLKQKTSTQAQVAGTFEVAPSASPNQKELLTMPKPTAEPPEIMEVPKMEIKPKMELPAMEFPKVPHLPNINLNVPIQANDIVEQKTYNIGPVGNKPYNAPVFQGPVQQGPITQQAPAGPSYVQQKVMAPAYPVQYVEHYHPHNPHCVCKTVIHPPYYPCPHPHHHHIHPHYYMHYAYVQPPVYGAPYYNQAPMHYGAQQAGAPGEMGPYQYQPYQPTNQTATIRNENQN